MDLSDENIASVAKGFILSACPVFTDAGMDHLNEHIEAVKLSSGARIVKDHKKVSSHSTKVQHSPLYVT